MKKSTILVLAVLLVFGLSTAASAALDLGFNIDFHTEGLTNSNPLHQYQKGSNDGSGGRYDTATLELDPCEYVWVDVYADVLSGSDPLAGAEFHIAWNQNNLEGIEAKAGPTWVVIPGGEPVVTPGDAFIQVATFAPVSGSDLHLGSVLLHCIGPGLDPVYLYGTFVDGPGVTLEIPPPGIVVGEIYNTPIPGAVWLLGSGLFALVGLRRKFK
jgi:hypothetical protein